MTAFATRSARIGRTHPKITLERGVTGTLVLTEAASNDGDEPASVFLSEDEAIQLANTIKEWLQ